MNRDPRRLRLILTVLVLISLTLIAVDYRAGKSGPLGGVRRVVSAVIDPIEAGFSHVFRPIGHFFSDLGHATSNGSKVRTLQQQLAGYEASARQGADVTRQIAELKQLQTLSAGQSFKILPAQVIGIGDASGFDDTVTIGVGSAAGVRANMTVIAGSTTGGGLVGYVLSTTAHQAQVAVIIDPKVGVTGRLRGNAQFGFVHGHGLAPLTFTGSDPNVRPKKGDVVETYGSSYPPGIPIGTVQSVAATPGQTTLSASVVPFISYDSLEIVGVVIQPATGAAPKPVLPTVTVTRTVTVAPTPPSGVRTST